MDRSDAWPSNDPHSPTHRSPQSPQRSLTELAQDYRELGPLATLRQRRTTFMSDDGDDDHRQPVGHDDSATTTTASSIEPDESLSASERLLGIAFRQTSPDQMDQIRSALSSISTSMDGADMWDGYRDKHRMVQETHQKTKQGIFQDIDTMIRELVDLEKNFEERKVAHQNELSLAYKDLNKALNDRMRKIEQRESSLKRALDTSHHGDAIAFPSTVVKLNVGGEFFETTVDTLRKDENSLLAMMFSGRHQMIPDGTDGSYFIDRDPTHFRQILNCLRGKRISFNLHDKSKNQELLQEARYYRIEELVKTLERHLQISVF